MKKAKLFFPDVIQSEPSARSAGKAPASLALDFVDRPQFLIGAG